MTRSEDNINRIHRVLSIAETELKSLAKNNLNNGNIVWEDIANRILNICFTYNTENLNQEKANFPGIDLGNRENGIGIQVTRRNDAAKLKETIEIVIKNEVYKTFPQLKFFILGRKKATYKLDNQSWESYLQFDVESDILDFDTVLNYCQSMEPEKLQKLIEYLEWELKYDGSVNYQSIEKIDAYMELVMKENSHIMIIGLGKQLPIERTWVQLQLIKRDDLLKMETSENDKGTMLTAYHEYSSRDKDVYDVETVLETGRKTVVLAGPGMGKSTLCKKLLFIAVRRGCRSIKVSLMDVAGYIRIGKSFDEALRSAMVQSLDFQLEKEEVEGQFEFLFLDGLDECGDIRRKVAQEISAWSAGHQSVKIVVTSRPIGYDFLPLEDFDHLEIQTLNPDHLNSYVEKILEELEPENLDSCIEWFEKQVIQRQIRDLACRSPLLLGFLLQMSIRKRSFGQYRCELYEQILMEWLQRSSRENAKKISESELLRGSEIIAFYMLNHVNEMYQGVYTKSKIVEYVGTCFEEELECRKLVGRQKAEICVDFWTERGILDRSYFQGEERYLFLHLNIGEFLAGKHISQMTEISKQEWINTHYRQSIWHESIRMAIACEDEMSILEKLLEIEQGSQLPNGAIFLAAEGVGEKHSSKVPQALYDKLLEYLQSDNPYLSNKAAKAIWQMEGKSLNWHTEVLMRLIRSNFMWIHDASYSVYLRIPVEEQDYEVLRNFMICYGKNPDKGYQGLAKKNMEETVKRLKIDVRDLPVIEAIKHLYYDHCTVAGMKILQEYLEQAGEKEWVDEYYQQKSKFSIVDFMKSHQRLEDNLGMLVQILADIYGTTEVKNPMKICPEYSKLVQVIGLMEMPICELMVLQYDLPNSYSKSILKAACLAGGIDVDRLKEELYYLLKNGEDMETSRFDQIRCNLSAECLWERTTGMIPVGHIVEGLCSKSDIMGIPSALIALANTEAEGMKGGICELLFRGNSNVMTRVGWLVPLIFKENSMSLMLKRLDCNDLPCYHELYDNLNDCQGPINWEQWLRIVKKGLNGDEPDVAKAVLKYLLIEKNEPYPENIKELLINTIKQQFELWLNKKVTCQHCKSGAILDESGFCPECNTGGDLPLGSFIEVLLAMQQCSKDELITYIGHENSDMSKVARAGLERILVEDSQFLDNCLERLINRQVPNYIFTVILDLPGPNLKDWKESILRLANGEETELTLNFIKRLNNQEWFNGDDRKDYLEKMIAHPDSTVRSRAMACWLGDDSVYNYFNAE